jgi:hypothetical protein
VDARVALAWLEIRAKNFERVLQLAREVQKEQPKLPLGHVVEETRAWPNKPGDAAKLYETACRMLGDPNIKLHQALAASGNRAGKARLVSG